MGSPVYERESVLWEQAILADECSKDVLRVVSFEGATPVLEKRYLYRGENGDWCRGVRRGLGLADLEVVLQHVSPIAAALRGK